MNPPLHSSGERWGAAFSAIEEFLRSPNGISEKALLNPNLWPLVVESYAGELADKLEAALQTVFNSHFRYLAYSYWSPIQKRKLATKLKGAGTSVCAAELSDWYNCVLYAARPGGTGTSIAMYELLCYKDASPKSVCISTAVSNHPTGYNIDITDFIAALKRIPAGDGGESIWEVGRQLVSTPSKDFKRLFDERVYKPLSTYLYDANEEAKAFRKTVESFRSGYANGYGQNQAEQKELIRRVRAEHLLPILLLCVFYDLGEQARVVGYSSVLPRGNYSSGVFIGLNRDLSMEENAMLQSLINQICWFPTLIENVAQQQRRAEQAIQSATRAAITSLVGRNLSHNLGSHVLRWMEQDARAREYKVRENMLRVDEKTGGYLRELEEHFASKQSFYRHLRERMDLLAAAAVYLPRWTSTLSILDLVDGLRYAKVEQSRRIDGPILSYIGRSEGAMTAELHVDKGEQELMAMPGSGLGRQAFYGIIENIARDAAKYGNMSARALCIRLDVSQLDDSDLGHLPAAVKDRFREQLLRCVVYDELSSFSNNGEKIEESIRRLELEGLCDEGGGLKPGEWGIKERYIFASYLRGEKPEDRLLPGNVSNHASAIPLLKVQEYKGKLAWVFYLLRPKDILLISDSLSFDSGSESQRQRSDTWEWEKLDEVKLTLIYHKLVVFHVATQEHADRIEKNLDYLPYRTLVYMPAGAPWELSGTVRRCCAVITGEPKLEDLELQSVLTRWVDWLSTHRRKPLPSVVSVMKSVGEEGDAIGFPPGWRDAIGDESSAPVALFDRHAKYIDEVMNRRLPQVTHYEPYVGGWAIERRADFLTNLTLKDDYNTLKVPLAEAALLRILVVDERIDDSLDDLHETFEATTLGWRELWHHKGVDVTGRQYKGLSLAATGSTGGVGTVDENPILEQVTKAKDAGVPYDFILLHQGILDKLFERSGRSSEAKADYVWRLSDRIRRLGDVWQVVIHSGRGGIPEMPAGIRFIHLSSIEAWFGSNYSKVDVVEELMALRKEMLRADFDEQPHSD